MSIGRRDRGGVGPAVMQCGVRRRRRQFHRRHATVAGVVDALGELPDADDDGCSRVEIHRSTIYRNGVPPVRIGATSAATRYRLFRISRASAAVSDGVLPTFTPAASRASFLAAAVPDEPDTMAPAWPIVLPSGAVNPAT